MSESPDKGLFRGMLGGARRQRRIATSVSKEETSASSVTGRQSRWGTFRHSFEDYFKPTRFDKGGFEGRFPGLEEAMRGAIDSVHKRGRKALALDICGEADAETFGADKTICLALNNTRGNSDHRTTVAGNLLERSTQLRFLDEIDASDMDVAVVVFSPVAAVDLTVSVNPEEKGQWEYSALQMYRLFQDVYERLASPGIFFIQTSNLDNNMETLFCAELEKAHIMYEYNETYGNLVIRE